jgi:carboxyl-terminal processing protease
MIYDMDESLENAGNKLVYLKDRSRKDKPGKFSAMAKEDKPKNHGLAAMEKKRKPLEYGSKEDFQLGQALAYLKGQPVQTSKSAKVENKKEGNINNPGGSGDKK